MNAKLDVTEMFESVNGEGDEIGRRTIFVRVFGCSANCPDCDTPYSKDKRPPEARLIEPNDIINFCKNRHLKHVTITGGEPFEQKYLNEVLKHLLQNGIKVTIETNGMIYDSSIHNVHVVVSPKPWMLTDKNRDSYFRWGVSGATFKFAGKPSDVMRIRKWFKVLRLKKAFIQPWVDPAKTNISHLRSTYEALLEEVNKQFLQSEDIRVVPQVHKLIWLNKRGV